MLKNIGAIILLAGLPLAGAGLTSAGATAGTLRGRVVGPNGEVIAGASVKLTNPITGRVTQLTTDDQGVFVIYNIPHNPYVLTVTVDGFATLRLSLDIHNDFVADLGDLKLELASLRATVQVSAADAGLLETDKANSHHDIDKSLIQRFPAPVSSRGFEQILLSTPGFIADENGRFHFRGSHGQVSYLVDGMPINDQLHITFSNSLDPRNISAVEVTTGGLPAEYGERAAVVKVTTKSGLESPQKFFGNVSYGFSRFDTHEAGAQFGGSTQDKRFGYFTSVAGSVSNRFLDPINFDNFHNRGNTQRVFNRFDFHASPKDTLTLNLSAGRSDREVPNLLSQQLAGQDDSVLTRDGSISLSWERVLSSHSFFELHPYFRSSQQQLFDSPASTPLRSSQARRLTTYGATARFYYERGHHRFKTGVQVAGFPLREHFAFQITDPAFNAPFLTADGEPDPDDEPANAGNPNPEYNPALRPHDATRIDPATGRRGTPFVFSDRRTGKQVAWYAQDTVRFHGFTASLGLRLTHYDLFVTETVAQPRIALNYHINPTGTVLRASYDRLYLPPENEGLLLANSAQAAALTAAGSALLLQGERQHSYEIGFQQRIKHWLRIDGAYYSKDVRHGSDNGQYLNTGVLFPVSIDSAKLKGFDLRLDVPEHRGFSAYGSFGTGSAIFAPPFTGGLLFEELPDGPFRIDHDQKFAAQWGAQYYHQQHGWWLALSGRYDSGLVAEVEDPAAIAADPDIAFGLNFVRATDDPLAPFRIRPRTIWNLSAGIDLFKESRRPINLQLDLLNLGNKRSLYNFLSVFGGTHVIPPRVFAVKLRYNF
jgi:hypothetical protein